MKSGPQAFQRTGISSLFSIFFSLLVILSCRAIGQPSLDSVINSAVVAERNKQFLIAAELYESVVHSLAFDSVLSYSKKRYVLYHLGDLYLTKLGRPTDAIGVWEKGAVIANSEKKASDELLYYINIGTAYVSMADYQAADGWLLRAERLARSQKDNISLKRIYETYAHLYQEQGDSTRSRTYQIQRNSLVDEMISELGEGTVATMMDEARSAFVLGNVQRALDVYVEALKRAGPDSKERPDILFAIAQVHDRADNLDEALRSYVDAFRLYQMARNTQALASCASALGVVYYQMGDLDSAAAYLATALDLQAKSGRIEALATDYFNLGLVFQNQGKSKKATDALSRSVVLFEHTRTRVAGAELDEGRRTYLASRLIAYEKLIGALYQSGLEKLTFMVMELAQARTLFETIQKIMGEEEQNQISISLSEIQQESSFESLLQSVYRRAGHASLDDIRSRLLGEDGALLEFFCGEERSYVFAATKEAVMIAELLRPDILGRMVTRFRKNLEVRAAPDLLIPECGEISKVLLHPIWPLIKKKTHLYIVPSGPLWLIPFESLLVPQSPKKPDEFDSFANAFVSSFREGDFLIRQMSVTYGQSASILLSQMGRSHYQPRSLIAFADPSAIGSRLASRNETHSEHAIVPLKYSRTEVNNIALFFPPEQTLVFMGENASEENAKKVLNRARAEVVHFATHGFLSLGTIGRVGVLLAASEDEDGLLAANEVARLELQAKLVVLSGCETGLGDQVPGEGTMGLARAFKIAGANSVIVSLWRVTDLSTSILMKHFYSEYASNGGRVAAALQAAQISMLESGEYSAPYYWAAFICVGR